MESANSHHHHHHLQDQFSSIVASSTSSSSLPLASSNFYGARDDASWNPLVLNAGYNFDLNVNGVHSISRNNVSRHDNDILAVPPSLNAASIQDLGFYWAAGTNSNNNNNNNATNEALHIAKIKDELSDNSSSKFSETSNGSSNPDVDFNIHFPPKSHSNKYEADFPSTLSEKLLFRTFSNGLQLSPSESSYSTTTNTTTQSCASFGGLASRGGNLGQAGIFPSGNDIGSQHIDSNLTSQLWGSLGVNLQALGLLSSTSKFAGGMSYGGQAAHANNATHNLGLYKDRTSSFGLHDLQDSSTTTHNSQNNTSSFMNEMTEAKRSSCVSEAKASPIAPKKPRVESRSSLTPFKVRKEKLGDRIAALQQLVAPFGKTDTASVLMEAIGYIKFLQDQVETLSVPYMKSGRNRTRRAPHDQGSSEESHHDQGEPKRDLRSSGLCLVPLSCMSYFANDGVGVWPPPPSFGAGSRT